MDLTDATFPEQQNRMGQETDEDTQKIPVVKPPFRNNSQSTNSLKIACNNEIEKLKEGPVTISKEASDRDEPQEEYFERGSLAVEESAFVETNQPVEPADTQSETSAEPSFRSPATPRRNVIPPRRTSLEAVQPTPHVPKTRALNGINPARLSQPLTPVPGVPLTRSQPLTPVPGESFTPVPEEPLARSQPLTPVPGEVLSRSRPLTPIPASDKTLNREQLFSISDTDKDQETERMIEHTAGIETQILQAAPKSTPFPDMPTTPLLATVPEPATLPMPTVLPASPPTRHEPRLTRGRAAMAALLLLAVIINATVAGFGQFFGPQGWGSAFNGSNTNPNANLLTQLSKDFKPTPGATSTVGAPTPLQIVNALLANMSEDEKLGQMMLVRFSTSYYDNSLNAMISQYHVGGVLFFNGNIRSKAQLTGLIPQMQQHANLPLIVSVDQEGGTVDRLVNVDGRQPSASTIGATGNPDKAYQQGLKDSQDLSSCGFNLNLGPVVDITNVYNPEMVGRTYGTNSTIVTSMATAYLKGLQESGKVMGTLKHFPGLGDTSTDPHSGLPYLARSLDNLNAIDWVPYKNMLKQNNVYSIMVTHEIVKALDPSTPSSLSPKVVSVLRNQLGFQGVIITDGLTMGAILQRYTLGQAAALAVEAGDDLLMDPGSPNEVAKMISGIKDAMNSGAISQQRIDDSVRRILLLKYQMGLLHISQ